MLRVLCLVRSFCVVTLLLCFFFQAEDGIRDAQESRGLGDVYKRQMLADAGIITKSDAKEIAKGLDAVLAEIEAGTFKYCLLYTSDAADDLLCVDLGGRRIIKKKTKHNVAIDSLKSEQLRHTDTYTHRDLA